MSSVQAARSKGRSLRARSVSKPPSLPGRARSGSDVFLGVATKRGSFVSSDILDSFTSKAASEQLKSSQDLFTGISGIVEPLYDPVSLSRHMEANTYHARCVRTKAQDTAGQGWELLPLVEEPSEEQELMIEEFFDSLEEDIQDVLVQAMTDRESVGWLSIEIAREDKDPEGPVVLVKNIPSHTMRAHEDGKRFVQVRGNKKVWFKRAGLIDIDVHKKTGEIGEARSIDAEDRANEVMWNNIYTARSDIYGVPDHIPAVGAILGDVARRDYNILFFENFGVPAYAVFVSGDYDPGDPVNADGVVYDPEDPLHDPIDFKSPMHQQIEAHLQEVASNPHSVLLLGVPSVEGGEVEVKFEKLAVEVREASFRMYRMDNRDEVLAAHAVPPYRAGIAEQGSLGGNVAENTDEIYRDSVLEPRQSMLNRLINRYILGSMEITDWTFQLLSINIEDEQRELDFAVTLFDHGAMTPNDLIRNFGLRYGLEDVEHPAMDAHYIQGVPIDAVLTSDVEATMLALRDELLETARKHVESGSEDGDFGAQLLGVLASLEASAAAAATTRERTAPQADKSVRSSNGRRRKPARSSRSYPSWSSGSKSRAPATSGSNGHGNG